jgi:anti-sigma-K factor RskA
MTCEELQQDYGAYALGILENPEQEEIAHHLAVKCPNCVPGVRGALAIVTALSGAVESKEPPRRLRQRIVGMISPEPKRSRAAVVLPWALVAALSIAILSITVAMRPAAVDASKLRQALAILNDPATKDVAFGEAKPSRGRMFVSPARGVVFIATNLPKIGPDRTFELWVLPAAGNPIPAGTFNSASDSSAVHIHNGPVENAAALAVTVEPQGGSPQPTTTPFIVSKL